VKAVQEARKLLQERAVVPLEGRHLVLDGLNWGLKPVYLFLSREDPEVIKRAENIGIKPVLISEKNMARLSSLKTPPGEILLVEPPLWKEEDFKRVVVLEGVQDPTNVGSIIRTAYCLGYDAVFTDETSAHPFSPKTVRASAGYSLRMPTFRRNLLETLKSWKGNRKILGTFPSGGDSPASPEGGFAVVFGNESRGIGKETENLLDQRISISMERGESLGVASAAAIILYLLKG